MSYKKLFNVPRGTFYICLVFILSCFPAKIVPEEKPQNINLLTGFILKVYTFTDTYHLNFERLNVTAENSGLDTTFNSLFDLQSYIEEQQKDDLLRALDCCLKGR